MANLQRREFLGKLGIAAAGSMFLGSLPLSLSAQSQGNCSPPQKFDFSNQFTDFDPCTNEFINVTNVVHVSVQGCQQNDGTIIFRIHDRVEGTAVGQTTGNQYVINTQDFAHDIISPGPCGPINTTQTFRELLISKGPSPNAHILMTETFTLSADTGCQPVFSFTFKVDCTG